MISLAAIPLVDGFTNADSEDSFGPIVLKKSVFVSDPEKSEPWAGD
jgi:hypothetical protein